MISISRVKSESFFSDHRLLPAMNYLLQVLQFISTDSLCSTIIALYTVLFLYFPSLISIQFVFYFSPVVLTTLILLLFLLRLGASQISDYELPPISDQSSMQRIRDHLPDNDQNRISPGMEIETCSCSCSGSGPDQESFVEWDVRAPLEVIYEEEHCEGDDTAAAAEETRESGRDVIQRYASLSLCYPESDGDTSSEEDFPEIGDCYTTESACFRWEEEEEDAREGLIEIELSEKRSNVSSEVDEENLIEIDLSPAR